MKEAVQPETAVEPAIQEVRRLETGVELTLLVSDAVIYFDGHFPSFPILPGIVQLDWAIRLARRFLALGAAPVRTVQVKFRKPIYPNTVLTLALSLTNDGRRLGVEYRGAQGPCVSARIGF